MTSLQDPPALPAKSNLRASKLLKPIDTKAGLDEQPPLSPATAPHDVYLSSEEDASSSADDFSDYDLESDTELDPESPKSRSQEDTARVVSFVFCGKPALVNLPRRPSSPCSPESTPRQPVQRVMTESSLDQRPSSVSSNASSSIISNLSRASTFNSSPTQVRHKPSFLSIDPFATRSEGDKTSEVERPKTPKSAASSMLKRTFSLARKRSKPHLNQAATQSQDVLPLRSQTVDQTVEDMDAAKAKEASLKASRRRTTWMEPPATPDSEPQQHQDSPKGHSRLRGLSISVGRRRQ